VVDGEELTIELDVDEAAKTFDFQSSLPIASVRVKGGPDPNPPLHLLDGATSGTDLHAPVNSRNDRYFGLSHVCFVLDEEPVDPPAPPSFCAVRFVPSGAVSPRRSAPCSEGASRRRSPRRR